MSANTINPQQAVAISSLRFGYGSGNDILAIPALQIATSQRVFLFGPSGSGKSTLLAIIGGVLPPPGRQCFNTWNGYFCHEQHRP